MAVTQQGAIDAMFSYFDSRPENEPDRYATELAKLLLATMTRTNANRPDG